MASKRYVHGTIFNTLRRPTTSQYNRLFAHSLHFPARYRFVFPIASKSCRITNVEQILPELVQLVPVCYHIHLKRSRLLCRNMSPHTHISIYKRGSSFQSKSAVGARIDDRALSGLAFTPAVGARTDERALSGLAITPPIKNLHEISQIVSYRQKKTTVRHNSTRSE